MKNHPQTRRRKARKMRRFVSEADAETMYEKYFDEHREEFELNRPKIFVNSEEDQ